MKNFFYIWLENNIQKIIKLNIIALNFNIYEWWNDDFIIELIGTNYYDVDDSDWPCYEIYTTRENNFCVNRNWKNWEEWLLDIKEMILLYLKDWKMNYQLLQYNIWVWFVDGDIEMINQKSKD